jgi:hypothetical protein
VSLVGLPLQAEEEVAMNRILLAGALIVLGWMGAMTATADPKPLRIFLSPSSTISSADIVRDLGSKCSNVSLTVDSKSSDYMLEATRWPDHYKFTLFRRGGDAVFSTSTHLMSNSVKDVCHYVNAH